MLAKFSTSLCLLLITSCAHFSEASESEFLKIIDSAGRKCLTKFNVSIANVVERYKEVGFKDLEKLGIAEIWCSLDCMASELGLSNKTLLVCSESDYNHRRQQVLEWIVDEWDALFKNGSFLAILHSKRPSLNSSRYLQLVDEASQKCDSKFEMTETRSLAPLFNPVDWLEERLKGACSFNCMLAELKIIDENGLNTILKNWISPLESVHEAVIKGALEKLNRECKFEENAINNKVSQHDANNFKNQTNAINSQNTEKLTTPKQQSVRNGASKVNHLFESTILKNVFIASSLSYSFLCKYI